MANAAPVETEAGCAYHNYALAFGPAAESGQVTDLSPAPDPGPYVPAPLETAAGEKFWPWDSGEPIRATN